MKHIPDTKARLEALNTQKSYIVQAPAGSGKTELLTQRILKLLQEVNEPENILAITFTRKAAAEMKNRIYEKLLQARHIMDSSPDHISFEAALDTLEDHQQNTIRLAIKVLEHNHKRKWHLLENPARLQIKTIDSFCSGLIFQLPVSSQIAAQSKVIEDAEPLFREASEQFLQELENKGPRENNIRRVLQHLGMRSEELNMFFISLLNRRLQWAPLIMQFRAISHSESYDKIAAEFKECISEINQSHIHSLLSHPDFFILSALDELIPFISSNLNEPEYSILNGFKGMKNISSTTPLDFFKAVNTFMFTKEEKLRTRLTKSEGFPAGNKGESKVMKEAMKDLLALLEERPALQKQLLTLNKLPSENLSHESIDLIADICECLAGLLAHLHLQFQNHSALDFSEIQFKAVELLNPLTDTEEDKNALISLDTRLQHILVDEFQDTSNSQLKLLENLCSQWKYQQESKTLFLVGDPMQSIYRFREANVGIFLRAQEHGIADIPLINLTLSSNFRSEAGIINWVNQTFSANFPKQSSLLHGAVKYSKSEAVKTNTAQKHVEYFIEKFHDHPEENTNNFLYEKINKIKEANPQDSIAILVRSKKHLHGIIQSFKKNKIHYSAIEIDLLSETPHILALCNLSYALLDLHDELAWYGLFRSVYIGLSNNELFSLKEFLDNNKKYLGIAISHSLFNEFFREFNREENLQERLLDVQNILSSAIKLKQEVVFSQVVERCWLHLGGPGCLNSDNQLLDCKRFFELLRNLEKQAEPLTRSNIERASQKLFAQSISGDENPVQLLTIHKAKGLEFDHVIIPSMHKTAQSDNRPLLHWSLYQKHSGKENLLLAPLIPNSKASSEYQLYDYLHELEKSKAYNESLRLLYVAATRARKKLYLLGKQKIKINKQGEMSLSPPPPSSFMGLIWESSSTDEISYLENKGPSFEDKDRHAYQLQRIYKNDYKFEHSTNVSGDIEDQNDLDTTSDTLETLSLTKTEEQLTGSLFHFILEMLVKNQIPFLNNKKLFFLYEKQWEHFLHQNRVFDTELLASIIKHCFELLSNCCEDEKNHWIFDPNLEESACEETLSQLNSTGNKQELVIDRTFISDGYRWIIDYKTSRPEKGETLKQFLAKETGSYKNQLLKYAKAYQAIESLPQKLALYFPAIQHLEIIE